MLGPAQLIIHSDAQIGMACCNFKLSSVHFISHQQGISFMCNMHDIVSINFKFQLPLGFSVARSVYIPLIIIMAILSAISPEST